MDSTQQTLSPLTFNTTHASVAGTRNWAQEPSSLVHLFSAEELHFLHLSPEFDPVSATPEAVLRPPTPSSPVNDIFLCPPLTTERFKPRQFDTPEEEEAWWSDPRTYPGDHLVAASNAPWSVSECDTTPRSYITTSSPEPSEHEDHYNRFTDPPQIHPTRIRPVHSSQHSLSSDESDGSEIEFFSDDDDDSEAPSKGGQDIPTHDMSNRGAQPSPRTRDGGSPNEEDDSDDEDVDPDSESEDSDEYSPDTAGPAHRARASHTRRAAALKRTSALPKKGTRTYKPRTTTPKDIKPPPKRREFLSIPEEHLPLLRNEEKRLRKSREKPPPFELPNPARDSNSGYRCSHVQDGKRCKITSGRYIEACRHTLTHFNVRFLCANPKCPLSFARNDSMKRHFHTSKCKNQKNHPPSATKGDNNEGAVFKEGEVYRLVRIVYKDKGALKSKAETRL